MVLSLNARECNFDLDDVPPEVRDTITVGELMAYRQAQKALSPIALEGYDTTAWKELRNTADGTPVQTVVADVQTSTADDISLDEALSIAQTLEPEKPKSKPRSKKKVSE